MTFSQSNVSNRYQLGIINEKWVHDYYIKFRSDTKEPTKIKFSRHKGVKIKRKEIEREAFDVEIGETIRWLWMQTDYQEIFDINVAIMAMRVKNRGIGTHEVIGCFLNEAWVNGRISLPFIEESQKFLPKEAIW